MGGLTYVQDNHRRQALSYRQHQGRTGLSCINKRPGRYAETVPG